MLPEIFTPELLNTLELFHIQAKRAYLGTRQGGHVSIKRGHGIEFSDYRKYELGDNPRHIDWGVYARSDRLYVKRFQEEQDLSVLIVLDTSASMVTPTTGKWEMARNIGLALAWIALMQQDTVTMAAPGHLVVPRASGARAIHHLGARFSELNVDGRGDFLDSVRQAVNAIRFPGVAIFISDLLMPLADIQAVFNLMRAKNLDITAIQVLSPEDLEPLKGTEEAIVVDSETGEEIPISLAGAQRGEYEFLLEQHNRRLSELFAGGRISFTRVRSDEPLSDVVINNLPRTGLIK